MPGRQGSFSVSQGSGPHSPQGFLTPYLVGAKVTIQGCVVDGRRAAAGPLTPVDLLGEFVQHLQDKGA